MTFNVLTVALPKVFEERLAELAARTTEVGAWVFVVIAFAAAGQVVVGLLLDRYPLKPVYVAPCSSRWRCCCSPPTPAVRPCWSCCLS